MKRPVFALIVTAIAFAAACGRASVTAPGTPHRLDEASGYLGSGNRGDSTGTHP